MSFACDTGKHDKQQTLGPAVRIVDVSVGDNRPMPADGAVQIAFDRYLLPSSVNRQSVVIVDGANQPLTAGLAPLVLYDPVARTITLAPPTEPWLTEGLPYKVILGIPDGDSDTGGIRAIDRAKLYADQKLEFAFLVGPKSGAPIEPAVSFCRDVLPVFAAKCSLSTCHGGPDNAAESLLLTTSTGFAATALNRLGQESNTGPRADLTASATNKFGVDMPLVDPGNPGNSWLMYKIELAPPPVPFATTPEYVCQAGLLEDSAPVFTPLATHAQRAADDIERSILSNYVLGREMPYPVAGETVYETAPLTFAEREKVRLWIASLPRGASLPECGGCGDLTTSAPADAGASDAADQ